MGASVDGHWTLSSKQKPGQGPCPLPGYLSHVIMTMLKKFRLMHLTQMYYIFGVLNALPCSTS